MSTTAMTTSMITTMLMTNSVTNASRVSGGTAHNLPLLGEILLFIIFNLILLTLAGAFFYIAYDNATGGYWNRNFIDVGVPTLFGVTSLLLLVLLWVLALG